MKKLIIGIFVIFGSHKYVSAQIECHVLRPMSQAIKQQRMNNNVTARSDWACATKVIALNFHYLSNNTRGNFTATGDGLGNIISGFDYANMLVDLLNERLKINNKMNLPPSNNTQVWEKNYKFELHSVNFHHNITDVDQMRANSGANNNFQMDVIVDNNPSRRPDHGWASTTNPFDKDKWVNINSYGGYYKFIQIDKLTQFQALNKILAEDVNLLNHELGHLLTLDHTVLYGGGGKCPTVKFNGVIDAACNDDCWDTPSAWHMTDVLNSPIHPGEANPNSHKDFFTWFSNNRMEYSGYHALSPCQLTRIHSSLEASNQMRSYLISERVKTDISLCNFQSNIVSYYGKKITINQNCNINNQSLVLAKRYVKIHANESTEIFSGFEVFDKGYFEVLGQCASW